MLKNNYNNLLDSEKGYVSDSFTAVKNQKNKEFKKNYSLES
jgi:hypothetical protein